MRIVAPFSKSIQLLIVSAFLNSALELIDGAGRAWINEENKRARPEATD